MPIELREMAKSHPTIVTQQQLHQKGQTKNDNKETAAQTNEKGANTTKPN